MTDTDSSEFLCGCYTLINHTHFTYVLLLLYFLPLAEDFLVAEGNRDPFIRKGSISSAYDMLPEELGRYVGG